jgi:hypothetical protein
MHAALPRSAYDANLTRRLLGAAIFGRRGARRGGNGRIIICESLSRSAANWLSRKIIPPMNAQIKKKHTPSAVGIRKNGMEDSSR